MDNHILTAPPQRRQYSSYLYWTTWWVKRSILGRVEAEKIVTHVFDDKERRRAM